MEEKSENKITLFPPLATFYSNETEATTNTPATSAHTSINIHTPHSSMRNISPSSPLPQSLHSLYISNVKRARPASVSSVNTEEDFNIKPALQLLVTTFNMANSKPQGFHHLIPNKGEDYDIFAMGFQECTFSSSSGSIVASDVAKDIGGANKSSRYREVGAADQSTVAICKLVENILGEDFYLVEHNKRAQLLLLIYARKTLKHQIKNIEKSAENTGFLHVFPNKGGLCISMNITGTFLTFVSCHLTAHEGVKKCQMRNDSVVEILGGIRSGWDKRFDPSLISHHIFLMGDLNYRTTFAPEVVGDKRISGVGVVPPSPHSAQTQPSNEDGFNKTLTVPPFEDDFEGPTSPNAAGRSDRDEHLKEVFDLIEKENWYNLLQLDELTREMAAGRVLNGFKALQPNFPPTFKRVQYAAIETIESFESIFGGKSNNKKYNIYSEQSYENGDRDITAKTLSHYNEYRLPSYTDRIVYKSLPGFRSNLAVQYFESCEHVLSSDHKPVRAAFKLLTTPGADGITVRKDGLGSFEIKISNLRGRGLLPTDSQIFNTSDPYITIFADPPSILDHESSDMKGPVVYKNTNPNWDEDMILTVCTSDYSGLKANAHLFFAVWNCNTTKTHSLIGVGVVSFATILKALKKSQGTLDFDEVLLNNGLIGGRLQGTISVANGVLPESINELKKKYATTDNENVKLSTLPQYSTSYTLFFQQVPIIGDLMEWSSQRLLLVLAFSLLIVMTMGLIIYYVIIK